MLSVLLRRTHMYLALFLMPWMLGYALSTMAMNHREFFREHYGGQIVKFEKETEAPFAGQFQEGATPKQKALQILSGLGLDGNHSVRVEAGGKLIVNRQDLVTPRRITFAPETGMLTIEREVFRWPAFLERFHRRRGFQTDYVPDDLWAATVDGVIVAILFWAASGLWMWWELRTTRRWGAIAACGGLALFVLFLVTI
jgi:hypothetical protein